jgi:LysR family glycine cleavage system transcriptional activator
MKLRDVPLALLPTFEAAARLGSFAAAASELHLTPSAISQQMRALEETLGIPLFERTGRTAMLTSQAESYVLEVRRSLAELAAATARLRRAQGRVLRLSTVALAAHEFLLPRLPAFRARFPEIDLRIETSNELVDFRVTDCDAAIRVGEGWPDVEIHPLGRGEFTLVCAQQVACEIRNVSDLARYTLLDPDGVARAQLAALHAQSGTAPPVETRTWEFETCFETMRAAEHGLGIAFAVFPVATPWVNSARLAVPLPYRVPIPGQVCLAHRPADQRFPFVEIAAWLRQQYEALPALPPGRIAHG